MFCYQESVSKGTPKPCTPEIWDQLIDSPEVSNICRRIAALDPTAEDYNDRKQALKRRLPIIIPHAASFKNGKRISADAIPSGLAMLDVDHVENPREWWAKLFNGQINEQMVHDKMVNEKIYLVAITASGHGIRIIGERLSLSGAPGVSAEKTSSIGSDAIRQLESIEAAQLRIAQSLGIKEFDAVTKDLARASYVVPRDYILWIYADGLFSSSIASGLNPDNGSPEPHPSAGLFSAQSGSPTGANESASDGESGGNGRTYDLAERYRSCDPFAERAALPPHVDPSSNDQINEKMVNEQMVNYRGIPYDDIVKQLLIATGNCDGAVMGERNTVYFSLANYMRYICDFNADLLLRILPDFGLSEQERRQAISSAIGRPRKSQIPVVLQSSIAICEREQLSPSRGEMERGCDLPLPELPRLLRLVCRRLPEDYRPAMVIASLPILGTLATRIRFEYLDRQEQSLSFFSCITAPAASGKSFIRKPLDLLLTPINEQDAIEREKEQAYKEKLRASKNSKNQPEDPHACPRNNGVAISIAKLLQLLTYAEGKHLIGIGEEMDTFRRRAGVIGFRAGMLCYLLENRKFNSRVGQFAEWVAEYVFRNQMELWGDEMEALATGAIDAQTDKGAASSLLALLPQEFTTGDLIKLRARKNQSVKRAAISMVLNRWKATHRIEPIGNKTFRKL